MGLKILWQNPFTEVVPQRGNAEVVWEGIERMAAKVVRPDTEIIMSHLDRWSGIASSSYTALIDQFSIVNKIIKAESEGYDAVVVGCYLDPGVRQAREVVNIPVIGPCESSLAVAQYVGRKFAVITVASVYVPMMEENIRSYGFTARLIDNRPVRYFSPWYWDPMIAALRGNPDKLINSFEIEALKAIDDGADTIIPGCAPLGAALTLAGYTKVANTGVPVVSGAAAALKMAEAMADLRKAIGLEPSRSSFSPYQTPPRDLIDRALGYA